MVQKRLSPNVELIVSTFLCLVYFLAAVFSITHIVTPKYSYLGLSTQNISGYSWAVLILINILPTLFFTVRSDRPTLYIFYIFYFVFYIPATIVTYNVDHSLVTESEALKISLAMFFSLMIILVQYRLPLVKMVRIRVPHLRGIYLIWIAVALFLGVVVLKLHSNFSIVGIEDVYTKRDAANSLSGEGVVYIVPWLANFFLPILFSQAYFNRKVSICIAVVVVYLALFFMAGAKLYLVALGHFMLAIAYCRFETLKAGKLALLFSFAVLLPLMLSQFSEKLNDIYVGIVSFRTFTVQAMAPSYYFDFFQVYSHTNFSHITGINMFVEYPLDSPVSVAFNNHYQTGNFNSNFLFGDGYAGAGFGGMFFISVFVAAFFYALDTFSSHYKSDYVVMVLAVFTPYFLNVPLMTSLITGGGVFFLLYFLFAGKRFLK